MALLRLCALALPAAASGMLSFSGHRQEVGLHDEDGESTLVPPLASKYGSALMQALHRGDFDGNASKRLAGIVKLGDQMTQETWLGTGPEVLAALKAKVFKAPAFRSKVESSCPVDGECAFNRGAVLFCESLDVAAALDKLGDLPTLEKLISATTASTRFYGVDTVTQSALIARWQQEAQWPTDAANRGASDSFLGLRHRIYNSHDFHDLVEDTCHDLSSHRPGCAAKASSGIFCQALGQSAAVLLGPLEASRRLNEVLPQM